VKSNFCSDTSSAADEVLILVNWRRDFYYWNCMGDCIQGINASGHTSIYTRTRRLLAMFITTITYVLPLS